jgi:hypothetical protein
VRVFFMAGPLYRFSCRCSQMSTPDGWVFRATGYACRGSALSLEVGIAPRNNVAHLTKILFPEHP